MEKINLNEKIFGDKDNPEKKDSLSSNPRNVKIDKQANLSEMDEKLDKIIKYQKRVAHMAVFRGVISFIFFLVFIVVPAIGGYYLVKYVKDSGAYSRITTQYQDFTGLVGNLKDTSEKVGDVKDMLSLDGIKNILNGGGESPKLPSE